jgi:asparagine synthase (glutamine-hydrolysing)
MCGITLLHKSCINDEIESNIKHRGPDEHKIVVTDHWVLMFDRLSINGVSNGSQPFKINDQYLICNGEIYNHKQLNEDTLKSETDSDCECILHLLNKYNPSDAVSKLDGVFAFCYVSNDNVIVGRDPIGVRPLYIGYKNDNIIGFCSEVKGLLKYSDHIVHFPPGHVMTMCHDGTNTHFNKYFNLYETMKENKPYDDIVFDIHSKLVNAVKKRLMSERPVAYFLSGGLDSSIIASIGASLMHPKKITCFSIGVKDAYSPDLEAAKLVAKHLNANHVIVEFSPEEMGKENLKKTINHLESFDCTTVRASVPMFILSEYISKNTDFKVILSGEGADELFGGYLYFHDAPDHESFQNETERLLTNVHQFDVLRADRCTAAHGLELRVPFFDKSFLKYVFNVDPIHKYPKKFGIEKKILRDAFKSYLPKEIIDRQKNGMSDAVGYSWVDFIKKFAEEYYCMIDNHDDETITKPLTCEESWYRFIFNSFYENSKKVQSIQSIWRPLWTTETDPSARKLKQFQEN